MAFHFHIEINPSPGATEVHVRLVVGSDGTVSVVELNGGQLAPGASTVGNTPAVPADLGLAEARRLRRNAQSAARMARHRAKLKAGRLASPAKKGPGGE